MKVNIVLLIVAFVAGFSTMQGLSWWIDRKRKELGITYICLGCVVFVASILSMTGIIK